MTVDLSRLNAELREAMQGWIAAATSVEPSDTEACYLAAAARTHSPSDKLACLLDAKLLHPAVPLSVNDDDPGFADWVAAREADNRRTREAAS